MVVVVALKVAEVAAAATVTDVGTVSVELVFVSVTLAPPVGAGWVKVTVQVVKELGPTLVGEQASEETRTDAVTVRVSGALPVPPLLVALNVTVDVPAAVGIPEITPVVVFTVRPPGNPVAP
jgi:hypothetical protein